MNQSAPHKKDPDNKAAAAADLEMQNETSSNGNRHAQNAIDQLDLSSLTLFSDRRSLFFISLLYFSDSLLIFSVRSLTDSFGWISVILSALLSAPLILLFGKLTENRKIGSVFLLFTKIMALLFIFGSLLLFARFIQSCVNMEVTPWLIPAFILITAAFAAFKDFSILKRSASLLVAIIGIFLIFSLIILWSRIDLKNIIHLYQGRKAFFAQMILFTSVFFLKGILLSQILRVEKGVGKSKSGNTKIIIAGLLAAGLLISAIQFVTLTVLGDHLYSLIEYPTYHTLGLTRYGDYFERTEVISLAIFMITLTFKISVLMRLVLPHSKNASQNSSANEG